MYYGGADLGHFGGEGSYGCPMWSLWTVCTQCPSQMPRVASLTANAAETSRGVTGLAVGPECSGWVGVGSLGSETVAWPARSIPWGQ